MKGTFPGEWEIKLYNDKKEGRNFSQIIREVLHGRKRASFKHVIANVIVYTRYRWS